MEARDPMFLPQVSASCDFMDAEVEVIANNFSMLRVTPTSSSGPEACQHIMAKITLTVEPRGEHTKIPTTKS
jgi:hypothetical protein